MAWGGGAGRGGASNKVSGTSLVLNPSASVTLGTVFVVTAVTDNSTTTTGVSSDHSLADSRGNTYTKLKEYTYSPTGAAADGVTVSVWASTLTTALATTDSVTLTLGTAVTAKAMHASQYSASLGNGFTLNTTAVNITANGTASTSTQITGLASAEHLFLAVTGLEGPTTLTYTEDTDYTAAANRGTSGSTASGNVWGHTAQKVQTATSSPAHSASTSSAVDWVTILIALDEAAGGPTQYTQEIDVTAGSTVSAVKMGQLVKSLSASSSVSVANPATKLVAIVASVGNAVSRLLQVRKPISVSEGSTVSAQKAASKSLSFTASFSAGTSPTLVKQVVKSLSTSVGNAVSVAPMRVFLVTIAATVGSTVTKHLTVKKLFQLSASSNTTQAKAASKTLSFSASSTPTLVKRAIKTLSMTVGSSVTKHLTVKKLLTTTVSNLVTLTRGGPVTYFMELDFTVDSVVGIELVMMRLIGLVMLSSANTSVKITKRISKTLVAAGSSLLSILRGVYYPGPDPSNQAFAGRSVNDVAISNGPNGVQFANPSQNSIQVQVSENSITVTEG